MKKILLALTILFSGLQMPQAQILRELKAAESPFAHLSDVEMSFLQTYSEQRRWEAYNADKQKTFLNTSPTFEPLWENLGPNTIDTLAGRMLCLTFHPDNSDTLYAGSGAGGLWRSDNAGDSWVALTDELPSMRISAVAVNPFNPDEILIGTGIGKVLSTSLQPGVGVLKSADGGQNWVQTSFNFSLTDVVSTYKLVYDPIVPDRVYLAATNGFFVSEDGGDTWQATNNNRVYDIELHPTEPGVIFIGTQLIGLQKSTNSGDTWTTISNGLPTGNQIFRTDLAICEGTPDVMMVKMINNSTFNDGGVYRSEDGGDSWTILTGAPQVACQPGNPTACSGWLFNSIGIAPDDPDKIYLGGVQFWYTHDGGDTWVWKDYLSNGSGEHNTNLVYVDHWDIDFDTNHPGRIYVSCDGGIIRSDDYGLTWDRKSNNLINAMMYSIATDQGNPGYMIGGFHDHGLQRWWANTGTTWERWSNNDGVKTLIDHQNPGVIYGNTQNGPIVKSYNYGNGVSSSFSVTTGILESGPWISPLLMNPENTSVLYTATNARIYKTTNGALNWSIVANIPNVQTMALNAHNPDIIYAHAFTNSSWSFHRSEDGGQSWQTIPALNMPTWGVVALESDPHQIGRIYAVRNSAFVNQDHIKVSEDHGATWTDITNDFPDIRVNDILVSPYNENHLFLATDLGVYFSENKGASWCPFNNNLPRIYTMDLEISEADTTLRAATFGRGVWKTSLEELPVSIDDPTQLDYPVAMVEVFPNPFQGQFSVVVRTEDSYPMQALLLDENGRTIQVLFRMETPASALEQVVRPRQELPPGIYFMQLKIGAFVYYEKIVRR